MITPAPISTGRITIVNKSQLLAGLNIAYKDEANIFTELQTITRSNSPKMLKLYRSDNTVGNSVDIDFAANDSLGNETTYGFMETEIDDDDDGTEDATMRFWVISNGTLIDPLELLPTGEVVIGSNNRLILSESNLTAARTITFPNVNSRLRSDSYVDNVKRKVGFIEDCFGDPVSYDSSSPLSIISNGTASGVTLNTASEAGHFGIWTLDTGTDSTGSAGILAGAFGSFAIGQGAIVIEFQVKFPTLSTAAQEYVFRMGLVDVLSGISADAVHLTYNRLSSGDFWVASTSNNSTATNTVSNTAVVADTWYTCRIEINAAGTSASFYINGTQLNISPISTNLPGAGRFLTWGGHIVKTAGSTARTAALDYYACDYDLTSVR